MALLRVVLALQLLVMTSSSAPPLPSPPPPSPPGPLPPPTQASGGWASQGSFADLVGGVRVMGASATTNAPLFGSFCFPRNGFCALPYKTSVPACEEWAAANGFNTVAMQNGGEARRTVKFATCDETTTDALFFSATAARVAPSRPKAPRRAPRRWAAPT